MYHNVTKEPQRTKTTRSPLQQKKKKKKKKKNRLLAAERVAMNQK